MTFPELTRTDGTNDPIHQRLRKAVEKRQSAYLWVPADTISFIPRLLPVFYGDGRALFAVATINQRPAYWIIRACSTWTCGLDFPGGEGPDFCEMIDEIMTDLEDAFGRGRCGYSRKSLFWPRRERIKNCQCEDCSDRSIARWPMVDDDGGCSWSPQLAEGFRRGRQSPRMGWQPVAPARRTGSHHGPGYGGRV